MAAAAKQFRGFTLVELVLVLLVIVICAMIAGPKLGDFARGRTLPDAAVSLATTARWCRLKATSDGVAYRLNLEPNARKYWVTKEDGTGTAYVAVDHDLGAESTLPDGIYMSSENLPIHEDGTYITFWPGGQTDVASIALSNDRGRVLNITCETPLGSYRVYDSVTQGPVR